MSSCLDVPYDILLWGLLSYELLYIIVLRLTGSYFTVVCLINLDLLCFVSLDDLFLLLK